MKLKPRPHPQEEDMMRSLPMVNPALVGEKRFPKDYFLNNVTAKLAVDKQELQENLEIFEKMFGKRE